MQTVKKFKAVWYNQDKILYEEPLPIEASTKEEALSKAYLKYSGTKTPGPLLSLEVI